MCVQLWLFCSAPGRHFTCSFFGGFSLSGFCFLCQCFSCAFSLFFTRCGFTHWSFDRSCLRKRRRKRRNKSLFVSIYVSPRPSSTQICWCFGSFCTGASIPNSILQFRAHRDGSPSPCFTNLYIQKTGKCPQTCGRCKAKKTISSKTFILSPW